MKIIVDYDKETGNVVFEDGFLFAIGNYNVDYKEASSGDVDKLVKLKNAGFTVDEIIELSRKELL